MYRYYSQYYGKTVETTVEATAKNNSYWSGKPYYQQVGKRWEMRPIPDTIDLSNTDTFHAHGDQRQNRKRHNVCLS